MSVWQPREVPPSSTRVLNEQLNFPNMDINASVTAECGLKYFLAMNWYSR